MINKLKTTYRKTIALENQVQELSHSKNDIKNQTNCVTFSRQLLNLSIRVTKKIFLAEFEVTKGSSLYFQNQIEMNLTESHKVRFTLIVNGVYVYRSNKELSAGYNNITIMKAYEALLSEKVQVYLLIEPEFGKEVILTGETLAVWGITEKKEVSNFEALETPTNFVLGFIDNQTLYYLLAPKELSGYTFEDFSVWGTAISCSFVYDSVNDALILFYVDANHNLFMLNFVNKNQTYIESDVDYVSACSNDESIFACYVKNNSIFYFDYKNLIVSNHKKLERVSTKFVTCKSAFNLYNNKFYIVGTDKFASNYLFESVTHDFADSMQISAGYTFNISIYGDAL